MSTPRLPSAGAIARAPLVRVTLAAVILVVATPAARAQGGGDSARIAAARAGAAAAREAPERGWFAAGFIAVPVAFAATAVALANQRNHPYAVPLAVAFDAGVLLGVPRLIRRSALPDTRAPARAPSPTGDERAAFDHSYSSSLREVRLTRYRSGLRSSGIIVGVLAAVAFYGLSGT